MKIQSDIALSSLSNMASSEYEKNKIEDFEAALNEASKNNNKDEIKKVAQDFEAFFIKTIFKSMRETSKLSESLIEKSFDREMYEQMMDEKMAEDISQGRGIGLAEKLYEQMIKQYGASDEQVENAKYNSIDTLK